MVRVHSEIGRLRTALVHEPGPEVDRMVPAMMEQLLFDDILYGDRAREEFARLRRVLQLFGIEVLDAADLLAETLRIREVRDWIIDVLLEDLPIREQQRLRRASDEELATILGTGVRSDPANQGLDSNDLYSIDPLPNWCFQRDPQVILGDGIVFCSMAAPVRHRESLLARAVFKHHPRFRDIPVLFDPIETDHQHTLFVKREVPHLEGGDLLVFSDEVIAVGLSERTNRTGIKYLARGLARREEGPRWLVIVEIPRRRAYMHLDTLITQVDRDACLVYPPVILPGGREQARVFQIDLHSDDLEVKPATDLLGCLASHGIRLDPIACGGDDPVAQQREQWTDGANALALAPGVITLYDRNVATADELARQGFSIVEADDLLLGRREIDPEAGGRVCILIPSHEISRARGGPHCLVHPLVRDVLS